MVRFWIHRKDLYGWMLEQCLSLPENITKDIILIFTLNSSLKVDIAQQKRYEEDYFFLYLLASLDIAQKKFPLFYL